MVLILLLIIVAIALGIVGAVAKGLFYLFVIGVVILALAMIYGAIRFRRGGRQPGR